MKSLRLILACCLFPAHHLSAITFTFPVNGSDRLIDGFVANDSIPIPVQEGLWWNPSESGTGYSIIIRERFGFVSWYTYREDGQPTFYTVQGDLQRLGELDRTRLGYAVVLRGPILRSTGGQNPGGTWTPATTRDAGIGQAEFRFLDSRRGELRLTGPSGVALGGPTSIQPFDPAGIPEDELLLGRWAISWRYQPGEATRALVEITRSNRTGFVNDVPFDPGLLTNFDARSCDFRRTTVLPDRLVPPSDSRIYTIRCIEGCVAPDPSVPPGLQATEAFPRSRSYSHHVTQWNFWYSPSQRRFGRITTFGTIYSCSDPADLFVTRDIVVGRGQRVVPFGNNIEPFRHTEFVLSRMPDEKFDRYLSLPP